MANENPIREQIAGIILKWKLGSASVQLQKEQPNLTPASYTELNTLLNHYREIDRLILSAGTVADEDPVRARSILKQAADEAVRNGIDPETHPSWKRLESKLHIAKEQERIQAALRKCDEAEAYINSEFNRTKADDALDSVKDLVPQWQMIPELRERIEEISTRSAKIERGMQIQQEISALRETGGHAAYQKALELLNEYDGLGLESYGIILFNVQEERDALLKMMVRAEGSSWTYRLTPAASQEIIRLEQSIRSLEDAESKNLRVLINNNSRLLTILIQEMEQLEPDSEEAIQAGARVQELRIKNQQLQTDILEEVAARAEDYCRLTREALDAGELKTAESDLRMAREAGKPIRDDNIDEYLGEVSLPTSVTDQIDQLQDELDRAQKTRQLVHKEIESIRKSFYSDDEVTINTLFSWKMSLENCQKEDPNAPGLKPLLTEINDRYNAARDYLIEKTVYDIDHDLENGNVRGAKERLDSVNTFFNTDEQKDFLKEQLKKINAAESLQLKVETLNSDFRRLYDNAIQNLSCSETELNEADKLIQSIVQIYADENYSEPQNVLSEHIYMRRCLQHLYDYSDDIRSIKNAAAGADISEKVLAAAENTEASELYAIPGYCELLANFWCKAAMSVEVNSVKSEQYFARAARLALDSKNERLQSEISDIIRSYNRQNERGQHIDAILKTLQETYESGQFIAGVDFISKNISGEEKSDPQVRIWVEKIEQAYRREQAEHQYEEAEKALKAGDLAKAEECIRNSLDFFYSIESAQLQKTILTRREEDQKVSEELQYFLSLDFSGKETLDEKDVSQIRYIEKRLHEMQETAFHDVSKQGECGKLLGEIEQMRTREDDDFNRAKISIRTKMLAGEESLDSAAEELDALEKRSWINNYRDEILSLKNEKTSMDRVVASLKAVIAQANQFAGMGDFKSARRILNSFTSENLLAYPGWVRVMKVNAEEWINAADDKYREVQAKFDPNNKKTDNYIQRLKEVFKDNVPSSEDVFRLQTDLAKEKLILEKDIRIENGTNVYLSSINYLEKVLHWAESISEFSFGIDFPQEVFPMEPLYMIRREGKILSETIPPLLIEVQPILARENKWLERRTRVRQVLQQINDCYSGEGKIRKNRFKEIEQDLDTISLVPLLPEEKEAIDRTLGVMKKTRRTQSLLLGALIAFVIILAVLYYMLPWIAGTMK